MDDTAGLRIVHVLRAPMGGVLRHVRDLALAQTAAGHAVGLICDVPGTPGYNEDTLTQLEGSLDLGVNRVPMARSAGFGDVASARQVLAILKILLPDVVHGHGAKGGVYARAIGGQANLKARPARFYSPHGGSLHYDPKSRGGRLYLAVERMLERACEGILFVAEYERETYTAKIGVPRCATRIVLNGLTEAEFEPVAPTPDAADFLFIGELRILKGPDLFVGALERLRAEGHDGIRAVMVGAGPDRDAIISQIEKAGLKDAIALHGPMPARQAFALARTVVMPSRAEAMPYIVLEALAASKPLIASRVGGIPEILGTDSGALIAPTLDAVGTAMRRDLEEPGWLAAQMPEGSALKARFSAPAMAQAITDAYRDALARCRPPPGKVSENATITAGPSSVS